MLVIGDRELAEGTVAVRSRTGGDLGGRSIDAFIADAKAEVGARRSVESAAATAAPSS